MNGIFKLGDTRELANDSKSGVLPPPIDPAIARDVFARSAGVGEAGTTPSCWTAAVTAQFFVKYRLIHALFDVYCHDSVHMWNT